MGQIEDILYRYKIYAKRECLCIRCCIEYGIIALNFLNKSQMGAYHGAGSKCIDGIKCKSNDFF